MRPLFVFDGLNVVGKDEITLEAAKVALEKTSHAWNLYGDNHPEEAVKAFGTSGRLCYLLYVTHTNFQQAQSELRNCIEFCKKFLLNEIYPS
jgi:hypothetical protein